MKKFTFIGLLFIFTVMLLAGDNAESKEKLYYLIDGGFVPTGTLRDSVVKKLSQDRSYRFTKESEAYFEMRKIGEATIKNKNMDFYEHAAWLDSGVPESYYYQPLICVSDQKAYAFPRDLNLFIKDTGIVGDSLAIKDLCEIFLKNWYKGKVEIKSAEFKTIDMVKHVKKQIIFDIWTEYNGCEINISFTHINSYDKVRSIDYNQIKTLKGKFIEKKNIVIPKDIGSIFLSYNNSTQTTRAGDFIVKLNSDQIEFIDLSIGNNSYFGIVPVILNNNFLPEANRTIQVILSNYSSNDVVNIKITITSTDNNTNTIFPSTSFSVDDNGYLSQSIIIPSSADTGIAKITVTESNNAIVEKRIYLCNTLTGTLPNSAYGYKVYYCNYYSDFNQTAADEIAEYSENALIDVYSKMVGQWQFDSPQIS
ncbi:MAG: hypothetical protein PHR06_10615 [Candidatus Cloacimonetes bacterium]|nr:hypothetical protein [Candidatus Cloacimonadota bacterium]